MLEVVPNRRLLMVDPCNACHDLLPALRRVGWDVDSCNFDSALAKSGDVGLLRLQPEHLENPETLKGLISRSDIEWIAVLTPEVLRQKNVDDFVCQWFFDFHTLPLDMPRMQLALGRALGVKRSHQPAAGQDDAPHHHLLGDSRPVRELVKLLGKLAPTESPVLIRGENGTGKELVARTLHRQSLRHAGPFISLNCGAVADHLIQSELFGHEQGAFPGALQPKVGRLEAAHGGTLFLEEIAALPLTVQASLLRFLQGKQIERSGSDRAIPLDVRVLAATDVDLEAAVAQGRFREDLFYRLNVLEVTSVPLRERYGDLPLLANHFAQLYSSESGRRPRTFSERALVSMGKHDWPGNVRELSNRVRRALVLAEGRQIDAADLGLANLPDEETPMGTLDDYKHRAERQALSDVLVRHSDNLSMAARVLGVSRPTFYRLLHKHQIR